MQFATAIQLGNIYNLDLQSCITVATFHNFFIIFSIYFHFTVVFCSVYTFNVYMYRFLHKMSYFCLYNLFQPFLVFFFAFYKFLENVSGIAKHSDCLFFSALIMENFPEFIMKYLKTFSSILIPSIKYRKQYSVKLFLML